MAETQDTGAATPAAPVSTAAAAIVTPVAAAAPAAAPEVAAAPVKVVADVKIRSRLNYSIGIDLADGEHVSLPAHATRTLTQAQAIDADGKQIVVPRGVFIVEAQ